jgi:hypothetical protein
MTGSSGARPLLSRSGRAALATALLAATLAILPLAAASGTPSASHPFASYDTGRVSVVLPSAHPSVEMVQDADNSVNALLSATEVVELAPSDGSYAVVASAAPTLATSFNGSRPAGTISPWALSLAAALPVRTSTGSLWNTSVPTGEHAASAGFGIAELRVDFAPGTTTNEGAALQVGWTVSNWPLANSSDLLGVVFTLTATGSSALQACAASSVLAAPPCPGSVLVPGQVRWNSNTVGVEADGASGAIASLGWSPGATSGAAAPSVSGERSDPSGGVDVVVANPSGTSASAGVVAFSLSAPIHLPSPTAVVGSGPVYLVAASIAAGGALGGVALYRERDERLRREL